jgi:hypothetical protein
MAVLCMSRGILVVVVVVVLPVQTHRVRLPSSDICAAKELSLFLRVEEGG